MRTLSHDIRSVLRHLHIGISYEHFRQTFFTPPSLSRHCPNLQHVTIIVDTSDEEWRHIYDADEVRECLETAADSECQDLQNCKALQQIDIMLPDHRMSPSDNRV